MHPFSSCQSNQTQIIISHDTGPDHKCRNVYILLPWSLLPCYLQKPPSGQTNQNSPESDRYSEWLMITGCSKTFFCSGYLFFTCYYSYSQAQNMPGHCPLAEQHANQNEFLLFPPSHGRRSIRLINVPLATFARIKFDRPTVANATYEHFLYFARFL